MNKAEKCFYVELMHISTDRIYRHTDVLSKEKCAMKLVWIALPYRAQHSLMLPLS